MAYKPLKFTDITRFLDARAPIQTCPSCSSLDWRMEYSTLEGKSDEVFASYVMTVGVPFVEPPKGKHVQSIPFGIPIIPMICNTCGYVRSHDYSTIRKWVEANPTERQDGDVNGDPEA